MTGRQRRRRKQLLDGIKKQTEYWKLKEEALDGTVLALEKTMDLS
jgi:hypothetical protein